MFNVKRTYPEPKSLANKKEYNGEDVLNELINIFYNKCYICEEKYISSINVEHLISHKGDINLKLDWENLFLAYPHCNGQKGTKFDNILDCTKDDVVNCIKYEIFHKGLKSEVKITAVNTDTKTKKTTELLNLIYEGETTTKKLEANNIKCKIKKEILLFTEILLKITDVNNISSDLKKEITESLSKESPFSAFKRWIVKNNKNFSFLETLFD